MHGVSTTVFHIVVRSLGIVTSRLPGFLKTLVMLDVVGSLQMAAIVGTTIILRKAFNIYVAGQQPGLSEQKSPNA